MLSTIAITVALVAGLLGAAVQFAPLPYPAYGSPAVIPLDKIPQPTPLQDTCPAQSLQDQLLLHDAVVLLEDIIGAETVAVHPEDGSLVLADQYGYVHRAMPVKPKKDASKEPQGPAYRLKNEKPVYLGPSRPLGLMYNAEGQLIVCDAVKGLLQVDFEDGSVQLLASRISASSPVDPGVEVSFTNDLDISSSGMVYFSGSSELKLRYSYAKRLWDMFETFFYTVVKGEPSGYLLQYNPRDGTTHALAKGIWFANGVALSNDESFVAVAETAGMRVLRYWLKGDKAGQTDVLVDKLPGYPDGLHKAADGSFWVTLVAPPLPGHQAVPFRLARLMLAWIPTALRPPVGHTGLVLKVSQGGMVLDCLTDIEGQRVLGVSSVFQHGKRLFFGNLLGRGISYITLP